ncbi:MAG: hypothetical protein JWL87_745 [Candidatus Adlerbacteria bacterium]|nr:hypothetical protein [Candidatus Adlerbacteria bacterium]
MFKKLVLVTALLLGFAMPALAQNHTNAVTEARLQSGLQDALGNPGEPICTAAAYQEAQDKHKIRLVGNCVAVYLAGSEAARQALTQSNAPCDDSCLMLRAREFKRFGFGEVLIHMATEQVGPRKEVHQRTLLSVKGPDGKMMWFDRYSAEISDTAIKKFTLKSTITTNGGVAHHAL